MMSSRWRRRGGWSAPAWARPTTGCRGEPFLFHHPHMFEWCWICLHFCITTAIEIVCLSRKYTPPDYLSFVIMFFDAREREKLRRLQALPPIRSTNVPISPSVWELWRDGASAERGEFWKGGAKTWDVMLIVRVDTLARKQWWDLATQLLSVNSPESRPWLCLTVLLQEG